MIKKIVVLCTILISFSPTVFAADWIRLNITNSDKYIYLDHNSITKDENNLFYIIRYNDNSNNQKIVYIKYDISNDQIGVVKIKDYNSEKYTSQENWKSSYAFMKKVDDNSLFNNINSFVKDDKMVQSLISTRQLRSQTALTNNKELIDKYNTKYPGMKDYIISVEKSIKNNWKLPITNNGGVAKIQFKISREGKLTSCEIKQSSGNKDNDNSALAAVKNTEPFPKFPDNIDKNLKEVNIIMTFDYYVLDMNKK